MRLQVAFLGLCVVAATQIAAHAQTGTLWGVNNYSQVWRWSGQWTIVPGSLRQVSVAPDGGVWGIDNAGRVNTWTGSTWTVVAGPLFAQISAESEQTVWGITTLNEVRRWDGAQCFPQPAVHELLSTTSITLDGRFEPDVDLPY